MGIVTFTTSGALQKSALRQANERLVLNAVRRHPGILRADVSHITGLSRTSVTYVVNRLLKNRLVIEEKLESGSHAGRPPSALRIRADAMVAVGVEIVRPVSSVVLVNLEAEVVRRQAVHWHASPELLLHKLHLAIRSVTRSCKRGQVIGAGVAIPGTIEKSSGRVIAAENIGWFGVDVDHVLRGQLPWPFFYENDANLSALAEQWFAPPEGDLLRYFVYVRLAEGLGTGVIVDGRTLHGISSAAAEFGHVMLYPDGRPCACGNRGCWEQYASEAALHRTYGELAGTSGSTPAPIDSGTIVRLARAGNGPALQALHTTASYLALGFVNIVAALNPQAIIVGEPMASAWDLVEDVIRNELRTRVPPYAVKNLQILPSRLGSDSVPRGAAALALAHYFTRFDHAKEDALPNRVAIETHV